MISRAADLVPLEFHTERVLPDPYCVNLQVSVDILPDGRVVPNRDRLRVFNKHPKVIFRFKTTTYNVSQFIDLHRELEIKRIVMETVLRIPKEPHYYGTRTNLEKRDWMPTSSYLRCNTTCANCHAENGFLACAATAKMLEILPSIKRLPPPRHRVDQWNPLPRGRIWGRDVVECAFEHGGTVTVQQTYAWFDRKYPVLKHGKPNWQFKVRVAMQRQLVMKEVGTWALRPEKLRELQSQAELTLYVRD